MSVPGSPGSRGTGWHVPVPACGPFGACLWGCGFKAQPQHSVVLDLQHSSLTTSGTRGASCSSAWRNAMDSKNPALGQPSSVFQRLLCTRSLPQGRKEHPASLWEEHRGACSCRTLPGPDRTQKHWEGDVGSVLAAPYKVGSGRREHLVKWTGSRIKWKTSTSRSLFVQ